MKDDTLDTGISIFEEKAGVFPPLILIYAHINNRHYILFQLVFIKRSAKSQSSKNRVKGTCFS